MLKWLKKKKEDNKGFTLVELVVVIAILAILVGLLVPQYTKYVDKARKSSDASNLANMVRAVEIAAADPNGELKPDTIIIKISDSVTTVTAPNNTTTDNNKKTTNKAEEAIEDTMGKGTIASTKVKSTSWKGTGNDNSISAKIVISNDYSFAVTYSENVTKYIESAKKMDTTDDGK